MNSDEILSFLKEDYGEPDHIFKLSPSQKIFKVYLLVYLPLPNEGIHTSSIITAGFSSMRSKKSPNSFEFIFEVTGTMEKEEYEKKGKELVQHLLSKDTLSLHSILTPLKIEYNTDFHGSIILNYGKHESYFWDENPELQAFEIIPLYAKEIEALSKQPQEIRNALIFRSNKIDWNNWQRPKADIIKEAVTGVWEFIVTWYEQNSERIFLQLKEGANKKSIDILTEVLGKSLPYDFVISLMNYNGEIEFHDYKYLSTTEIAKTWKMMKEILDSNSFPNQLRNDKKIPEIKEVWWHKGWIPFAMDGGGNLLCIDLVPSPLGSRGQIIYWEKTEGPLPTQYKSFFHWLFAYEQGLYRGYYNVDENGFIYH